MRNLLRQCLPARQTRPTGSRVSASKTRYEPALILRVYKCTGLLSSPGTGSTVSFMGVLPVNGGYGCSATAFVAVCCEVFADATTKRTLCSGGGGAQRRHDASIDALALPKRPGWGCGPKHEPFRSIEARTLCRLRVVRLISWLVIPGKRLAVEIIRQLFSRTLGRGPINGIKQLL